MVFDHKLYDVSKQIQKSESYTPEQLKIQEALAFITRLVSPSELDDIAKSLIKCRLLDYQMERLKNVSDTATLKDVEVNFI